MLRLKQAGFLDWERELLSIPLESVHRFRSNSSTDSD